MAFDRSRNVTVMFGGEDAVTPTGTWEYDGIDWSLIPTAQAPQNRWGHAMVYDEQRGTVVLFGGLATNGSGHLADTWEFDGIAWTQVATTNAPSPRANMAMAYDSLRGKTILFGGAWHLAGTDETWEFDGTNWQQIITTNSPGPVTGRSLAYDRVRDRMVLNAIPAIGPDGTWEFDGTDWSFVTSGTVPFTGLYSVVFDEGTGRVIAYGGSAWSGSAATFVYDGLDWVLLYAPVRPNSNVQHAMAYDVTRDLIVLYGGQDQIANGTYFDATWEYRTLPQVTTTSTPYGASCGSTQLSSFHLPHIGSVARVLIDNTPTGFVVMGMGSSATHFAGVPILPLDLSPIGMPGCDLLQSNESFGMPVYSYTSHRHQYNLPIPASLTLLNTRFYLQAFSYAPSLNSLGIDTSNGLELTIGNQ